MWYADSSSSSLWYRSKRKLLCRSSAMSRVPLVRCSNPAKLDWYNERGVDQDIQLQPGVDQPKINVLAPCGQERHSQYVQRLRCDELLWCHLETRDQYAPGCWRCWRNQTSEYLVSIAGISCGKPVVLSCLLQEESTFLLYREHQGLIHPQFSGDRETLIFPDSIKRGHNRRGKYDRTFKILSAVFVGWLQTVKINEVFNRFDVIAINWDAFWTRTSN